MGILEFLTLILIVMKVLGIVTWSWWVVLLPTLVSIVFYILVWVFVGTSIFYILRK